MSHVPHDIQRNMFYAYSIFNSIYICVPYADLVPGYSIFDSLSLPPWHRTCPLMSCATSATCFSQRAGSKSWRGVLPCVAVCCRVLPCVVVCCSVLQCVVVCCSVLQCVAVCCSVYCVPPKWYLEVATQRQFIYAVATISRPLKITGLFCKRAL